MIYKYKFENIELETLKEDDTIINELEKQYKFGWELINISYYSESKYEYNNGSIIKDIKYAKLLFKKI